MGSPLSPIVSNLFMENFEKKSLDSFPLKPTRWKRFVDDTNVLWPHGRDKLQHFFQHLRNISEEIKFTMEIEENGIIPFLDILINRKSDGNLGHAVYRKKTHTENYLHADSHHHPNQKLGVLKTLATRAIRISDETHDLKQEKYHLSVVFTNTINKALEKTSKNPNP
jgi:hypothetical protein